MPATTTPEPLFPWDTLRSIIGGASALDLPRLRVTSDTEAHDFIRCYGFDWAIDEHRVEAERIRVGAIAFIEAELLPDDVTISPEVRAEMDVRRLVRWASSPELRDVQRWSCALLRVMHAVAHSKFHLQDRYGRHIRQQILDLFQPHIARRSDGLWLGGEPDGVPLVSFESKQSKPLVSTIMKLLHKTENVATDIFDHVGVRFVTRDRLDALLVVRYLRVHNVIMFANIKPTRSRNTLVDTDALAAEMDRIAQVSPGLARSELLEVLRATMPPAPAVPVGPTNAYSDDGFRSIQYTCRQMIRVPGPPNRAIRFFFPFEVQILDVETFDEISSGRASHLEYRARQCDAVRRRVLRELIHCQGDNV